MPFFILIRHCIKWCPPPPPFSILHIFVSPASVSPVFDTALFNDDRQNKPPHTCGLCYIHQQHGQHRLQYSGAHNTAMKKTEGSRRQCVKYGSKHKYSCLTTHCASLVLRFHSNGTTHAHRQRSAPQQLLHPRDHAQFQKRHDSSLQTTQNSAFHTKPCRLHFLHINRPGISYSSVQSLM
jgi:hypothetical protein